MATALLRSISMLQCRIVSGSPFFASYMSTTIAPFGFQNKMACFLLLGSFSTSLTVLSKRKDDPSNSQNIKQKKRKYTNEEDKLVVKTTKELRYNSPFTWRGLGKQFKRNCPSDGKRQITHA